MEAEPRRELVSLISLRSYRVDQGVPGIRLFEVIRTANAAMKASAELHTPDGKFITARFDALALLLDAGKEIPLQIGGMTLSDNTFSDMPIAIHLSEQKSLILVHRGIH